MDSKKILIINEWPSYLYNESGCNAFCYSLINFLIEKGFFVEEIILKEQNNNEWKKFYFKNYNPIFFNIAKGSKFIKTINNIEKQIKEIVDKNQYKLIISNFQLGFKEINKMNNFFFVPHNSYDILAKYGEGVKKKYFFLPFNMIVRKIINHRNPFKSKNIVVFCDLTQKKLLNSKKYKNYKIYLLPIFHNFYNSNYDILLNEKDREGVFFIGRLSDKQKNIKFLNKVAKELLNFNIKIDVYGKGPDDYLLNSSNIIKHGFVNDEIKREIFLNKKILIMTSRYEGSPISLIEATSFGIPIILLDTFPFAKYITKNTGSKLLDKKISPKKFALEIVNFLGMPKEKYKEEQLKCLNKYKKCLSNEIGERIWEKILKDY